MIFFTVLINNTKLLEHKLGTDLNSLYIAPPF